MAQAFSRLESQVFLLHKNNHILDREDPDAADILQKRFVEEGIQLLLNSEIRAVELRGRAKIIHFQIDDGPHEVTVDEVLIGVGRAPNVEALDLECAGVSYDTRTGVAVNDLLQTTNPNIYAAGDICMNYKFTHAADAAARLVVQNALFMGRKKLSALTIPWCTYTDPEIAHVGMYERDARGKGILLDTFIKPLSEVDRAVTDGQDEGFVKVHVRKGTDEILGATIVASHAGDMISQITLAIVAKLGLKTLSGVIYPYPTQAEAIKQVADAYNRTRLTPFVKKLLKYWLSWLR
jgi:pyruvate/2-oxoglutarate dehydrogenase complex dihydrolipoamide dehydrogenase (E3) component